MKIRFVRYVTAAAVMIAAAGAFADARKDRAVHEALPQPAQIVQL